MLSAVFDRYGLFDAYVKTEKSLQIIIYNVKKRSAHERTVEFTGAEDGDRTRDPNLGKVVLYL